MGEADLEILQFSIDLYRKRILSAGAKKLSQKAMYSIAWIDEAQELIAVGKKSINEIV